jgi:hypothetical protein
MVAPAAGRLAGSEIRKFTASYSFCSSFQQPDRELALPAAPVLGKQTGV